MLNTLLHPLTDLVGLVREGVSLLREIRDSRAPVVWISAEALAAQSGVTVAHINRLAASGQLPGHKLAGSKSPWVFVPSELQQYIIPGNRLTAAQPTTNPTPARVFARLSRPGYPDNCAYRVISASIGGTTAARSWHGLSKNGHNNWNEVNCG